MTVDESPPHPSPVGPVGSDGHRRQHRAVRRSRGTVTLKTIEPQYTIATMRQRDLASGDLHPDELADVEGIIFGSGSQEEER